ncbi:TDP-N-acetylfucosamine:lipid II N-acetylfucosaminyltransferase [Rhodopirellula sp. P2]|uniref:TDP-N-acetylfucosamine:lipid II N-acetylfucosaminyltransferase n=1 Tax=Rhodopirellula sp. P2 TaxID=2127060 RepID=UPI002367ACC7|nr:TDP-N-acetylfucosamine:lipid II N-acetylfucosaminyltransferase [Rhodopirellula sp. P2]WDQ15651.1 TDP-N-acetylfucosamine:lipid II N-acetylfucosaminyltransferase [Rhodopirellula sp. P2]
MNSALHLLADSPYGNMIAKLFTDALPEWEHTFFVCSKGPLRYPITSTRKVHSGSPKRLTELTNESLQVIVSNGVPLNSAYHQSLPDNPAKVWVLWGFEVYANRRFRSISDGTSTFTMPGTSDLYRAKRDQSRLRRMASFARQLLASTRPSHLKDAIEQFDHCVMLFREEYDMLQELIGFSKLPLTQTAGVPLDSLIGEGILTAEDTPQGRPNNILLGNSASPTCNHVEAIERIQRIGLPAGGKVIVPLSYGDKRYGEAVSQLLAKHLPNRHVALTDFMPIDKYNDVLGSCPIVLMNHLRQQAVGNILASIYRGAIVYLNRTPVYLGLKRMGIDVRLVDDLKSREQITERLETSQVLKHREILEEHVGRQSVTAAYRKLFDCI